MNKPSSSSKQVNERPSAEPHFLGENEGMFRMLFERSADAILLFDAKREVFVDCNQAAIDMMRASSKEQLLLMKPADLSPELQPDGLLSRDKAPEMTRIALTHGSHRFEWQARRFDGTEFCLEVLTTPIQSGENPLLATICRDVTERKKAERDILQLNASLEQRVAARTAELLRTNQQLIRAESELRQRSDRVQKHRDVLLELVQLNEGNLRGALAKICALAAETLASARVGYWSLSEDDQAIVCECLYLRSKKGPDESSRGVRVSAPDCPAYFHALAARRPIVAHDALTHVATVELAESYLKPLGITSMLDAPVWVRGRVVGVLCHEHVGPAREWLPEEIDFGSALAVMVSLALEEANRARSEHSLRESEEKFRALFEASSQGIILLDAQRILEVNPACLRILGFQSPDEIVGRNAAELSATVQPNGERVETVARRYISECVRDGSARFEWMVRSSHGSNLPVETILTRIRWGGRQIIQAVFHSIEERKRAEAELRESARQLQESEARFSTAFHASPVLTTITNLKNTKFVETNDAFVKWVGYSREEIIGRSAVELGLWNNPAERPKFLDEVTRVGFVRDIEVQFRTRTGVLHTMLLTADRIEIQREPHLIVFALDITQRKKADAEMQKALARERELGLLRSKFVSMVSHEFRTPLGIIQSSAEILDDYLEQLEPGERKEHLQSIQKNTKRMAGLMEEVLLLSKFDVGKMEFKPAPLDPRYFFRRLVDEVLSATQRRCPIELAISALPPEIRADESMLRHIFTNLLTNGVKYSEPGCPVLFEAWRDDRGFAAVIRDRGIGIPEADQEWLFSAFHRGGNVGERPGTGLGLVIVKRCVDLHGGTIAIESKVGLGTSVTVRLPQLGQAVA